MNHRLLVALALGFGGLVILQAAIGGWLFVYNIGITPHEISTYYHEKSFHGLLEVLLPHTLFITIALMGLLHFLAFIDTIDETLKTRFIHILFSLFVMDQTAGVLITLGWEWCSYLKLISWAMFELALGWVWITLYLKSVTSSSFQR